MIGIMIRFFVKIQKNPNLYLYFSPCRGVGAMELVAMDMKLRGIYIARQLSFHGVSFKIQEIPVPKEFIKVYDNSVRLVSAIDY